MSASMLLISALLLTGPQTTAAQAQRTSLPVTGAVVIAKDDVLVPAKDSGPLTELMITEGMMVQQGQTLAKLDQREAVAQRNAKALELDLAIEQAKSEVEILAAVETYKTAAAELEESLEINEQEDGAIPATQVRRQQLQAKRAQLQADVAREEKKIAILTTHVKAAEVKAADLFIERRLIKAPLSGRVVQLLKHQGEWMQPGEALARVLRMDVLRVEGFVNSNDILPDEVVGLPVVITVLSPQGAFETDGTIVFANPVLGGSGDYRVVAEMQNQPHATLENGWRANPGMKAEMEIRLDSPGALPGGLQPPGALPGELQPPGGLQPPRGLPRIG